MEQEFVDKKNCEKSDIKKWLKCFGDFKNATKYVFWPHILSEMKNIWFRKGTLLLTKKVVKKVILL